MIGINGKLQLQTIDPNSMIVSHLSQLCDEQRQCKTEP